VATAEDFGSEVRSCSEQAGCNEPVRGLDHVALPTGRSLYLTQ
jgi:hypothetical protein